MFELNNLAPLVKKRKRVGRGGSRGGTSGKGHKGQLARSGKTVRVGFEGGQMPLYRRLPKRGYTNARFKKDVRIVNVKRLDEICVDGDVVDRTFLIEKNVIKPQKSKGVFFVKVLGDGTLEKKLTIKADSFSKSAITAIEKAGGQAELIKE